MCPKHLMTILDKTAKNPKSKRSREIVDSHNMVGTLGLQELGVHWSYIPEEDNTWERTMVWTYIIVVSLMGPGSIHLRKVCSNRPD